MKHLVKLCFLVPIPIILGIVLTVVGNRIGNAQLAQAGVIIVSAGTPAIMFILVVVGLVMMITGRWSFSDGGSRQNTARSESVDELSKTEEPTAAEKEAEKIADINSSYGYSSRMKTAQFEAEHVANAYRSSSRGDKIKGWLFFGFLMTDFALIMVFAFLRIMLGALICFCIFGGTIILSLIIKVILEKTSKSRRIDRNKYDFKNAAVLACVLSSMASTGGGRHNSTTRVVSVTYRIVLDVDGKEYNAYSQDAYAVGEEVAVAVKKNGKGVAKILGYPKKEEVPEIDGL